MYSCLTRVIAFGHAACSPGVTIHGPPCFAAVASRAFAIGRQAARQAPEDLSDSETVREVGPSLPRAQSAVRSLAARDRTKAAATQDSQGPAAMLNRNALQDVLKMCKGKWYKKVCEERRKSARQDWEVHSGKGWPRAAGYAFSRKRFFGAERSRHCAASRPMRWTAMTERATVRRVRRPVSPEVGGSMWR